MDYVCSQQQEKTEVEISKAEFDVLNAIWQGHPCSANDIIQRLDNDKDWHEKTVKTLLGRLVKKQAIAFEKDNRRYLYYPLLEKQAYQLTESKSLLDRLFGGKVSPLVANFAQQQNLQKDDIEDLKKLIADWEKNND